MKRLAVLLLFVSAVLCGCGRGDGEVAAPESEARHRIHYHVGLFMEYDPPWADHSRWMKPEAIEEEEEAAQEKSAAERREADAG